MAVRILTDDDVQQQMTMNEAIEVMARSFRQHATGALVAPARLAIPLDLGQLVFTAGSAAATDQLPGRIGFRVYDTAHFGSDHRDELVAVFDIADGSLQGVVVGQALGPLRTGAIGAGGNSNNSAQSITGACSCINVTPSVSASTGPSTVRTFGPALGLATASPVPAAIAVACRKWRREIAAVGVLGEPVGIVVIPLK